MNENVQYRMNIFTDWTKEDIVVINNPIYTNKSIPVALELADENEDWEIFTYNLKKDIQSLLYHLKMCSNVFNVKFFTKLSTQERNNILLQ